MRSYDILLGRIEKLEEKIKRFEEFLFNVKYEEPKND